MAASVAARLDDARTNAPGLAVAAACAAVAYLAHGFWSFALPLVVAVVLGIAVANIVRLPPSVTAGAQVAGRSVLRIGIVLLGFRLMAGDAWRLGGAALGLVVAVVVATFGGTLLLGRLLGLSRGLSMLTATGFAICGASAIAAVDGVIDADDEEVTYAIGLVTLCGSLAILVLPLLGGPLGLDAKAFGVWTGASVHDVGQVITIASTRGRIALEVAILVKLTRVVLLGPLVAAIGFRRRKQRPAELGRRTPLVPGFVLAFLAAVAIRSTGVVPTSAIDAIRVVEGACLVVALAALGLGVDVGRLRRLGHRPVVLGLVSWVLIAGVSYAGVLLIA